MLLDELAQRNIGYDTGIFEEGGWENISAGRQSMQKKGAKKTSRKSCAVRSRV